VSSSHSLTTIIIHYSLPYSSYTAGCDIVLQDTYVIGNNVTFSSVWNTPCTPTFGDCGSASSFSPRVSHLPYYYFFRIRVYEKKKKVRQLSRPIHRHLQSNGSILSTIIPSWLGKNEISMGSTSSIRKREVSLLFDIGYWV